MFAELQIFVARMIPLYQTAASRHPTDLRMFTSPQVKFWLPCGCLVTPCFLKTLKRGKARLFTKLLASSINTSPRLAMAWNTNLGRPVKWTTLPESNIGSCGLDLDKEMADEFPVWEKPQPAVPSPPHRPGATPGADRVLREPELLQLILTQVDFKTLLLTQRVSSFWQSNIRDTTTLQKKLFLTVCSICRPLHSFS